MRYSDCSFRLGKVSMARWGDGVLTLSIMGDEREYVFQREKVELWEDAEWAMVAYVPYSEALRAGFAKRSKSVDVSVVLNEMKKLQKVLTVVV